MQLRNTARNEGAVGTRYFQFLQERLLTSFIWTRSSDFEGQADLLRPPEAVNFLVVVACLTLGNARNYRKQKVHTYRTKPRTNLNQRILAFNTKLSDWPYIGL
jgi:hypothetical protein